MQQPRFSDRLRRFIKSKGMSIRSFASKVQIPYKSIQEYTAGNRYPGGEHLTKIAAFGIDINWLLTGKWSTVMQYVFDNAPDIDGVLAEYPDLAREFMSWCMDRTTAHQRSLLQMPGISGPMPVKRLIGDTFLYFQLYRPDIERNRDQIVQRLDAGEAPREVILSVFEYVQAQEQADREAANFLNQSKASAKATDEE